VASKDRLVVSAEGRAAVAPGEIWRLVADANQYPKWGPWSDGGYLPPGDGPSKVGQVQWIRSSPVTKSVEKILEVEDGRRLVYTVIKGIPVRNYRAEVLLTALDQGTLINWSATWDSTVLGRAVHRRLVTFFPDMMNRLVAYAEGSPAPS